jgi:putative ABC transport system permease protein
MTRRRAVSVLRTQLAGISRRPGRLVMTGLSVLVAAFVAFGTVLAYQITANTTLDTFSQTTDGVDLVIDAGGTAVSPATLAKIRAAPGIAAAAGRAGDSLFIAGTRNDTLEVDSDPGTGPLAQVRVIKGAYPTGPRQVAVDQKTADRLALAPGARLTLRRQDDNTTPPMTVTVTGVVDGPGSPSNQAYAQDSAVAKLVGAKGFTRVDIQLAPGVEKTAASAALQPLVGTQTRIDDGAQVRLAEAKAAVSQFDIIFALIAMFVAVAVIAAALVATSTFRIVFAQRLRQLALLRIIGARRGQLTRALAVEGAITGAVAGAVGVALAQAAGLAAPAIARQNGIQLSSPGIPAGAALLVIVGATLVAVGAVLAPAVSAAGVAPLQALRSASTNASQRGISKLRLGAGLALLAGALLSVVGVWANLPEPGGFSYSPNSNLMAIVASGTLTFGALITLGPVLVGPLLRVAGWPLRRLGPTGRLAVGGVGGAPRRAAAVSVVVALGVTLVSGTLVGSACLRAYVDRGLAVNQPTDFFLTTDSPTLPPDILDRLQATDTLTNVTGYRSTTVTAADDETTAADLNLAAIPTLAKLEPATGKLADLRPGRVVLSGPFAERKGFTAGNTLTIRTASRTLTLTVAATLPGAGPLSQDLILTPTDLNTLGTPTPPTAVLANAAHPGIAARNAAHTALSAAAASDPHAAVAVLADQRDDLTDDISALFQLALGLLGLTVLIAVIGVGTTTALSVLERTQESGLLRALGLSRAHLRFMLTAESGLYGIIGAVLGLTLGIPYAWLSITVLNLNAPLRLPLTQLLALFIALAAITALAGLLPARRAARVSPVAALGTTE